MIGNTWSCAALLMQVRRKLHYLETRTVHWQGRGHSTLRHGTCNACGTQHYDMVCVVHVALNISICYVQCMWHSTLRYGMCIVHVSLNITTRQVQCMRHSTLQHGRCSACDTQHFGTVSVAHVELNITTRQVQCMQH